MKIRLIEKTDDKTIAKIIRTSLEDCNLAIPGTAYFDSELDQLSTYYAASPKRNYFVITEKDEILGGVGIAEFYPEKNICELQKLYLTKKAQGKGYSNELMVAALAFATKAGYRAIYLESHNSLQAALSLYQKFDFKMLKTPLLSTAHNAMDCFLLREL